MIQNLCNLVDELNFDTFYKATIIEASQLPKFNHLTPKSEVLAIINNLPDSFQAMVIPFLKKRFSLADGTKTPNGNIAFSPRISFPIVPQDAAIQALLDTYNNKEVLCFVTRVTHSYLYGTQAQPLLFTYDELHDTAPEGLKGYSLNLQGNSYAGALYFAGKEVDFPVINRGLAFELAGSL